MTKKERVQAGRKRNGVELGLRQATLRTIRLAELDEVAGGEKVSILQSEGDGVTC